MKCMLCDTVNQLTEIRIVRNYTGDQPLHVCKKCGMVQVVERRSPEEIHKEWEGQSAGDDIYLAAKPAVIARHAYVEAFMDLPRWSHVIDIGAGDGSFEYYVEGNSTISVESYNGLAEDLKKAKYDAATILWTLENCGDPYAFLAGAYRSLSDDGKLIVATGSRILVPFKKPIDCYISPAPLDLHPWRFSAATLVEIIERAGFLVTRTNRYIDSDYLVVEARKGVGHGHYKDDYEDVIDFFNRWHKESGYY